MIHKVKAIIMQYILCLDKIITDCEAYLADCEIALEQSLLCFFVYQYVDIVVYKCHLPKLQKIRTKPIR